MMRGLTVIAACRALPACGSDEARIVSPGTMASPDADAVADAGARHTVDRMGGRAGPDWRRIATAADRGRLRGWRDAWVASLAQVDRQQVAREPALFDPDHALDMPLPPPGAYRCRTFKLGGRTGAGPAFTAYGWFACRIGDGGEGEPRAFVKSGGSQRPIGRLFPEAQSRGIFLGTMELGDETRPMPYGRDANRDMIGLVERIGPRRWRVVLPFPRFESMLDVIELVPDA